VTDKIGRYLTGACPRFNRRPVCSRFLLHNFCMELRINVWTLLAAS
jgi:hypothetical protein